MSAPEAVKAPPAGLLSQSQTLDDETLARQDLVKPILVAEALVLGESDFSWILWLFRIHRYNPTYSSWSCSQKSQFSPESRLELRDICGAIRSGNELSALLVTGTPARTCGKWPILRKAASLLSGNLTRTPGPDLLVGPFEGDFLSVSSNQCTLG